MRRTNLIELQSGVNKIEFTSDDFPVANSKTPIAILPLGTKIVDTFFDVKIPFKSGNVSGQTNPESAIIARPMLGIKSDRDSYLTFSECSTSGKLSSNTGSYFTSPISYDTNIDVILENWLSPRVWSIGGDLTTARDYVGGLGSQNASVAVAGTSGFLSSCEEYNGASWSAGGSLSAGKYVHATCGSLTAGLSFAGRTGIANPTDTTEEYNGSAWSGGGSLNTAIKTGAGCGTQNAALSMGGYISAVAPLTEEYNGSVWASGNDLNIGTYYVSGCGTQTAGLITGGVMDRSRCEEYNGSSWAISNSLNETKSYSTTEGSQDSAFITGGYSDGGTILSYTSEEYDGTNWSVSNTTNYFHGEGPGGSGSQSAGLCFGGDDGTILTSTEHCDSANMSEIQMNGTLILNLTVI